MNKKTYEKPYVERVALEETTFVCTSSPSANTYGNDEGFIGIGSEEVDASEGE